MKRTLLALLLALMLVFTLAACGNDTPPPAPPAPPADTTDPADPADTAEEPDFAPGEFQIRLGTVVTGDHAWIQMAEFIQEELAERSNGAIEVSIFPGGQLGNDEAMIDDMRLGTLDMIIGGTQNAAPFVPQFQVLSMHYLFPSSEAFERVLGDEEVVDFFQQQYDDNGLGLVLLGLSNGGQRNLHANREVHTVDDLGGMRMRVTASITESLVWSQLGTLPVSMAFNEIYTAVQSNVVDSFEVTAAAFVGSALYEVAPFLILTNHQYTPSHITFSGISFDRMPAEIQALIREVSAEAVLLGSRIANEADNSLHSLLVSEHGVTLIEVDRAEFRAVVEPLYPELTAGVNGEEIFEIISRIIA